MEQAESDQNPLFADPMGQGLANISSWTPPRFRFYSSTAQPLQFRYEYEMLLNRPGSD